MNNLFLEGPIQTGKSTLIREALQNAGSIRVGGFTVQRITFTSDGADRMGFRLMQAAAPIKASVCVNDNVDPLSLDGVFKMIKSSEVNLNVFETKGVSLLRQAIDDADNGLIDLVLLDEIGGHEMVCNGFRKVLYELLDSYIPCIGVVKLRESAERMASNNPEIMHYNDELHKRICGLSAEHGKILYYERGDEAVYSSIEKYLLSLSS